MQMYVVNDEGGGCTVIIIGLPGGFSLVLKLCFQFGKAFFYEMLCINMYALIQFISALVIVWIPLIKLIKEMKFKLLFLNEIIFKLTNHTISTSLIRSLFPLFSLLKLTVFVIEGMKEFK